MKKLTMTLPLNVRKMEACRRGYKALWFLVEDSRDSDSDLQRAMEKVKDLEKLPKENEFLKLFLGQNGKNRLSRGNTKLDKSIGIWSLPAVHTCINCEDCKKDCYARKSQWIWPAVRQRRFLNYVLAYHYPMLMVKLIDQQIKRQQIKAVRIHESGDFFDNRYANVWQKIAKRNPDVRFFFYTKNPLTQVKRLASLPNVNMVESILPDGSINFGPLDYVKTKQKQFKLPICPATDKRIDQTKIKCGKTCKACQYRSGVLFILH